MPRPRRWLRFATSLTSVRARRTGRINPLSYYIKGASEKSGALFCVRERNCQLSTEETVTISFKNTRSSLNRFVSAPSVSTQPTTKVYISLFETVTTKKLPNFRKLFFVVDRGKQPYILKENKEATEKNKSAKASIDLPQLILNENGEFDLLYGYCTEYIMKYAMPEGYRLTIYKEPIYGEISTVITWDSAKKDEYLFQEDLSKLINELAGTNYEYRFSDARN